MAKNKGKHKGQLKAKLKKNADKIKEGAKLVALLSLFGPLAPLAEIYLHRRGIKPAKTVKEKIVQIFNESQKKSFGLVEGGDSFEYGLSGTDEFGPIDKMGVESYGFVPITPGMVMGVISFLKNIFSSIQAKKAKGEPLSEDEKKISDMEPQIVQGLEEAKTKAEAANAEGEKKAAELEKKADESASGTSSQMKIGLAVLVLIILAVLFLRR